MTLINHSTLTPKSRLVILRRELDEGEARGNWAELWTPTELDDARKALTEKIEHNNETYEPGEGYEYVLTRKTTTFETITP